MKSLLPGLITLIATMSLLKADDFFPEGPLRALYDRADLIIEATLLENCEGGMSTAPLPRDKPQVAALSSILSVQVDRVLKGESTTTGPLLISVTQLHCDKTQFPIYRKGDRHIFVLEDGSKREPASRHARGDEIIRYRSFDPWFAILPVNEAMAIRFTEWGD